jgi:hypothetical protein
MAGLGVCPSCRHEPQEGTRALEERRHEAVHDIKSKTRCGQSRNEGEIFIEINVGADLVENMVAAYDGEDVRSFCNVWAVGPSVNRIWAMIHASRT